MLVEKKLIGELKTFNEKKTFRGELALVIAVLINSFSVVLMS